jgi:Domain of unknown function (DUF397)
MPVDLSTAKWKKSKFSGVNGCVEVAFLDGTVAIRDSKDRNGPVLRFTAHEWATFVNGVRNGVVEQSAFSSPLEE